MAINSTTNLGLALPDQGEWDGTWGTNLNNQITTLIDSAVAGTTTLSADSDVTLTDTDFAANQSRQAIILWTASNGATTRNITAPARSKTYVVVNDGTGSVVLRGDTSPSPTTGITIVAGERCVAAWNSNTLDFVKVASSVADGVTSVGGTGTVNGITLTGTVTSTGNLTLGGALSGVNLTTQVTGTLPVANGGTGITSLGTGVATFLGTPSSANLAAAVTDETGTGALVFANSPTLVTPTLGTPASGTLTNATGLPLTTGVTGTLPIANGGTGQTTANAAFNALVPSQTGNSGKVLTTNGSSTSWTTSLTAAGSNTQVQFNSSGVFGASANLTFDGSTLTVNGIAVTRGANSVGTNTIIDSIMQFNTTGNNNVAVGSNALYSNTTGFYNTAIGSGSMFNHTTGESNTALGFFSLRSNTTGNNNTAVGSSTLGSNTTGANNVAVGEEALTQSTSSSNTALGFYALRNLTSGAGNIAIGEFAGSSVTTGGNNTLIGGFQGSTSLAGVVAINAGVSGATRVYIDSSGNVGFNTTSPTAAIDHTGSTLRLRTSRTPASASATGTAGEICWDSSYVYVCVATDTWKRTALSTW